LPFKADTEGGGIMAGNACYNLIGEPEAIRQCIETKAVDPVSDTAKAKIIVARIAVFPDVFLHFFRVPLG
jgi:hypothetical protein